MFPESPQVVASWTLMCMLAYLLAKYSSLWVGSWVVCHCDPRGHGKGEASSDHYIDAMQLR